MRCKMVDRRNDLIRAGRYGGREVRTKKKNNKNKAWIVLEGGPSPTTGTEPVGKYVDFCISRRSVPLKS